MNGHQRRSSPIRKHLLGNRALCKQVPLRKNKIKKKYSISQNFKSYPTLSFQRPLSSTVVSRDRRSRTLSLELHVPITRHEIIALREKELI
ncbi:hypothetical protein CDAR_374331 [Caerostris darwini]|uniref:Ribosomal protein S4 n=1 Tax=Caerostris darwini TaxID=1538125 RepID=A0AAV4QUT4_9ARAC|nr:hypothetical protein CDAR_374331 [Caerostris darwini]